jgi:hypothetical protein
MFLDELLKVRFCNQLRRQAERLPYNERSRKRREIPFGLLASSRSIGVF